MIPTIALFTGDPAANVGATRNAFTLACRMGATRQTARTLNEAAAA